MQCFHILLIIFALFWLSVSSGRVRPVTSTSSPTTSRNQWSSTSTSTTTSTSGNYYELNRDGGYVSRIETPSGIIHFEIGYLRRTSDGTPYQVKEGYYIYPTPDGRKVHLSYFADHRGFRVISYNVSRNVIETSTKPTTAKPSNKPWWVKLQ